MTKEYDDIMFRERGYSFPLFEVKPTNEIHPLSKSIDYQIADKHIKRSYV